MGILTRFTDIISANINALIDKAENPATMVDQYLRKLNSDLTEVKKETASVMAEEKRCRRLMEENEKEVAKYLKLAKDALLAQNENDAEIFLEKKQKLEEVGADSKLLHAVANENAVKMRKMHDKLVNDINMLEQRRNSIKSKVAIAKTTQRVNAYTSSTKMSDSAMSAFNRMEEKANRQLDIANEFASLGTTEDEAQKLETKYMVKDLKVSVSNELAELKLQMGLD